MQLGSEFETLAQAVLPQRSSADTTATSTPVATTTEEDDTTAPDSDASEDEQLDVTEVLTAIAQQLYEAGEALTERIVQQVSARCFESLQVPHYTLSPWQRTYLT